jgi:hypothetical protein
MQGMVSKQKVRRKGKVVGSVSHSCGKPLTAKTAKKSRRERKEGLCLFSLRPSRRFFAVFAVNGFV